VNVKSEKRKSLAIETINSRMTIALYGKGTVFFDPRPVVACFSTMGKRRDRKPHSKIFTIVFFYNSFFSKTHK